MKKESKELVRYRIARAKEALEEAAVLSMEIAGFIESSMTDANDTQVPVCFLLQ